MPKTTRLGAAALSGLLLIAAFPGFNQPWCAWVALVPWLWALRGLRPWQAFGLSYLAGLVFGLGSLWWLIHVTLAGWVILCLYLALFSGVFGWLVQPLLERSARSNRQSAISNPPRTLPVLAAERWLLTAKPRLVPVIVIPSAWVATEYLRSHLLSGFGWNLLAYSQTPVLPIIQIADVTGAWGVSWLIVAGNVGVFLALSGRDRRARVWPIAACAVLLASAWLYGRQRLQEPAPVSGLRVAVVQGNIPQDEKWDEAFQQEILQRYARLTRESLRLDPHLIVWPETSVPGFLGGEEPLTQQVLDLARSVGRPLLVGAPVNHFTPDAFRMTNAAALLGPDGRIRQRYDKTHLVPLGEFVPLESVFPWLRDVLPPIGDFAPGHEYTVFNLPRSRFKVQGSRGELDNLEPRTSNLELPFSVLICFEDVFPELAREFVARGARLLLTITNDAWFGKTAAAYQHAQASTFRAVELRVPMVRAANTGWSGCIDARGRWRERVRDAAGDELFVEGVAACEVAAGSAATGYLRWGDWLALVCCGLSAAWLAVRIVGNLRSRRGI